MNVPINYLAVLVAAFANMVLGFLWYGPVFGKVWMRLSGITPDKINETKTKGMNASYAIAFVGSLLMSFVLAHSIIFAGSYLEMEGVGVGLMTAWWSWLGFIAPVTTGMVLWEGKSWKLWILTNAYYLVALCVMGVILAVWDLKISF